MVRKVTIIGGAGFVGTNLCRNLALKKQDFEIIDLKVSKQFPDQCKIGDVRSIQSMRETVTGDVVVNLAAIHHDNIANKQEYRHTNVIGSENVALICDEKEITKIVFTSSVAVYGFAEAGADEDGAINPFNEYGRTKYEAEEILRAWHSTGKKSLIIVRPTVIFGEGNRGNVYNLLNQIASGKFLMIGRGENKKSMAYIGNIVSFLEACIATNKSYALYNYVDTPDFTMKDLVSKVRSELKGRNGVGLTLPYWLGLVLGYTADIVAYFSGKNLPVSSVRVRKFASSSEFRSSKASLDNFKAPFLLEDGLQKTLVSEFVSPDPDREVFFAE